MVWDGVAGGVERVKGNNAIVEFVFREWLLCGAFVGLVLTSLQLKRVPVVSGAEFQVAFLLWLLLVATKGLERSRAVEWLSRGIERGRLAGLKLVAITFFLSMVVTNDVALIVVVPLTLSLETARKDILVILEALAANAGSALTPLGNPQNLFIYWTYRLSLGEFLACMAPLSGVSLVVLSVLWWVLARTPRSDATGGSVVMGRLAYGYVGLLVVVLLIVVRVLPVAAGVIVPVFAIAFDRRALRVDYLLLATFFCFFGLADSRFINYP